MEKAQKDYSFLPEPLIYCKESFFTLWWVARAGVVWDTYVGMDGLVVFFGLLLRFFGRVKRLVFWAIDFVPEKRFNSRMKNKIYHSINTMGYKRADEMWDLSPRMAEAREKFLGIQAKDYRSNKVVPYGVWLNRIKFYSYEECEKDTLVFMGHLLEKQGVQLVIEAIPELIKKNPRFHFKIIGDGSYKENLVELATNKGVLKYCDFRGKIDDIVELEQEVAKSAVAIAPYIKRLDTWTYYADPGKVKTYLAAGVPVLLTDVPWNAHDIEEKGCGKIIDLDRDFSEQIIEMMSNNEGYRQRAREYAKAFDYGMIFNSLVL